MHNKIKKQQCLAQSSITIYPQQMAALTDCGLARPISVAPVKLGAMTAKVNTDMETNNSQIYTSMHTRSPAIALMVSRPEKRGMVVHSGMSERLTVPREM